MKLRPTRVCPLNTHDLAVRVLTFVEYVSNVEFYSYQRMSALRIIESLLMNDGDVITLLFARQSGKSEEMGDLGLGLTIAMPVLARTFPDDDRLARLAEIRIGIFGPNQDSTGPIYERIRNKAVSEHVQSIVRDPEIDMYLVQSRGDSLQWNLGSYIKAKTASENAFVEGGTYHLILIDEAQKVSATKVNKEISPMRAATNGTMVKIGTAWMSRGGFHTDIKTNLLVEKNGGKKNHYEFDYEVVIREKRATYERQRELFERYQQQVADFQAGVRKSPPDEGLRTKPPDPFHLQYEKYIASEIRRLGGTTAEEFKMNFRLLWQESRQIAITDDQLARAASGYERSLSNRRGLQCAGLDIAKNTDSTVLTIVDIDTTVLVHESDRSGTQTTPVAQHYSKSILSWTELQGSFENIQYNAIVEQCTKFAVARLVGDSTGLGDPFMERLEILLAPLNIEVVHFTYTRPSKSDLFKYYLQEFCAGRVRYPAGEATRETREFSQFIEQHADLTREWEGSYLVCAASAEDLHDDYPCSAALAVWGTKDILELRQLPTVQVDTMSQVIGNRMHHHGGTRADRYRGRR